MATIAKVNENTWLARFRKIGYPNKAKRFTTREEADAWIQELNNQIDRGIYTNKATLNKIKLKTILQKYMEEITPTKQGKLHEESKIKGLMKRFIAEINLGDISPVDIVQYRITRSEEVGPATVAKEMNLLSNVFNVARTEWGMRGLDNPVQGVKRPKQPKGRERRLISEDEVTRIIDATQSPILKLLIPFAIETTMRRSEMINASMEDVDLRHRTITLWKTKNGESRTVPLSTRAVEYIKKITPGKNGRIFPVRPNTMTQAFGRAVKRARKIYVEECRASNKRPEKGFLLDLRLHDMRHEGTSRLFEKTDLREFEIMMITGHKDTRMLKRYTHVRAKDLAKRLG